MLKLEHVSKTLGENKVLNDCSLTVEEGNIIGIIGINGAGKSTLLRSIAGVYKIDEGSITFHGENIYENETVKKDILFLSDDPYYENKSTIASLKQFYQLFYPEFDEEKYKGYLKMTNLDEHKPLRSFSKGMRRQAFIILMLSLKPKLLILDESFDGLDPMMRSLMKKVICDLVVDEQTIVLISSHSLSDVESICDKYVIMDHNTLSLSADMDECRSQYHRFQLAFEEEKQEEDFNELKLVEFRKQGRVCLLVVEGKEEEIIEILKAMHPMMMEELPMSLEDVFVSKVKGERQHE